jgi:hypothetical protein
LQQTNDFENYFIFFSIFKMEGYIQIPRIFDISFTNLFYKPDTKKFYLKKEGGMFKSVHTMKETIWKQINLKYKRKNGTETTYSYRYFLVPQDGHYIRVKEGEYERFLKEQNESPEFGIEIYEDN